MDLTTLTDAELDQQRIAALTEQERRSALVNIPAQITQLAATYTAGGGNVEDLSAALNPVVAE